MDMRHYKEWIKIGLNILYYRKERRMTQQQLADECGEDGISRAFIQRIETGVSSCSVDTLIDIAKALNITPNYLSNQFRKETGSTISDYIRRHRIDAALRLLNTTDLSIQEIGERIGIGDSSYFSHQFKSIVGMSPMEYRKMVHGHVNDTP